MSLFRKPRKPIQRRVFTAADGDDDDAEPMETDGAAPPLPPPPPRIRDKPGKEREKPPKQTLLSFADEEEDGEVFRVKKSSQSKRLARAREKERRRIAPDEPPPLLESAPPASPNVTNSRDITHTDKEAHGNGRASPERERRGAEGMILAGRAALVAAATGDVEGEEDERTHDDAGFHMYRPENVRAALTRGHIPDAALIHVARKTRQQARETGRGDYIPLASAEKEHGVGGALGGGGGSGSRLVREDGSGDEEEEERLCVRGVMRDARAADERGCGDAGAESGGEEWEEQQLQKAVSGPGGGGVCEEGMQLNLFAAAPPPPPSLQDAPAHLRPLRMSDERSAHALRSALNDRVAELRERRARTATEATSLRARLLGAMRTRDSRSARAPELDAAYRRAQAARSYFTDLIECIDEKMRELETLEARALLLHRRHCDAIAERRRTDTNDQAQDALAQAARPGTKRPPDSEEKQRRAAEREGRRRARRLAREQSSPALAAQHRDGDSSDDELPLHEREHERAEREAVSAGARLLFADALPAWRSVRGVCRRLARWRRLCPRDYRHAYVADCLPRLLAAHVRAEIVLWNPLADQDNDDYEKMDWYKCLVMYGVRAEPRDALESGSDSADDSDTEEAPPAVTESSVREDPDLMLAPAIVARVLLPKLTELVQQAWDPLCVRATTRLRAMLLRACALPPRDLAPRAALAAAVRARLFAAIAADVFLPTLPPQLMEGSGGAFWRRCLGAGVRLLRAVLALCPPPPVLNADAAAARLIGTLCTAAGAAPATASAQAAAALASTLPRAPGRLRRAALHRVAALAAATRARLDSDNPLHLKALEQARGVLAEAKAEGVTLDTS